MKAVKDNRYHCFAPVPARNSGEMPWHPLTRWRQEYLSKQHCYSKQMQEALAGVIPLLLCGEQSAQWVFNNEVARLQENNRWKNSKTLLQQIEADEWQHDKSLQTVISVLDISVDDRQIKYQAQKFYTQLGKIEDLSAQFVRISVLDTYVAQLMQCLQQGAFKQDSALASLCSLIERDELRHISISRRHAKILGAKDEDFVQQSEAVMANLHQLLSLRENCFEYLGVDLDHLYQKISTMWR